MYTNINKIYSTIYVDVDCALATSTRECHFGQMLVHISCNQGVWGSNLTWGCLRLATYTNWNTRINLKKVLNICFYNKMLKEIRHTSFLKI